MNILHLSDLHLGKRIYECSMIDEQRAVLAQALDLAREADVTQSGAFTLDEALALIPHEDVRRVLRHAFAQYTHNEVAHG